MKVLQFMSLLVFLWTLPLFVENISENEVKEIKSGLQFAQKITGQLESSSFIGFLNTATTSFISYVSTTFSFLGFVLSFVGFNESRELLEIKRMYNEMNRRFNLIDIELDKLKKEINWSQVKLQYSSIEQTILTNSKYLRAIYENPLQIKDSEKDYFIHSFENDGLQTAYQLYLGLIGKGLTLNDDLLHVAMTSFEYDRPKTQQFMIGLLKLFADGITTELAYRKYKYQEADYTIHKAQWAARFHNVTERMITIDNLVRSNYYVQAEKDIARLSEKYPRNILSNRNFSEKIYNFIVQKYDWRDWLIIVYRPTSGVKNHYNYLCGGYHRYGMFGRDIAVASVDQSKQHINITEAEIIIRGVNTKPSYSRTVCSSSSSGYGAYYSCNAYKQSTFTSILNAQQVYNTIPSFKKDCSVYASVGVIDSWVDLWYQGLPNRLAHKRTPGSNSYSVHIFG